MMDTNQLASLTESFVRKSSLRTLNEFEHQLYEVLSICLKQRLEEIEEKENEFDGVEG